VGLALLTQMGEQADYLRFMPEQTPANRRRWWAGVAIGGVGWVLPGVAKMLGGALLAVLAIQLAVPVERAVDPNQMYLAAWETVFPQLGWAVAATALFVIVSQLKINVTNAYAGSLAWSNFFARATHSHPGRVVWMVFNIVIALMLMEMDLFQAIGGVLGLYANVAISWLMAVVADLVVNKPLSWSPPGIEFKRAHLHDLNPVGVGATGAASVLSVAAHAGLFGPAAMAFSALIAAVVAFTAAPAIAWATRGRHYLARSAEPAVQAAIERGEAFPWRAARGAGAAASAAGLEDGTPLHAALKRRVQACAVCERGYEAEDMASCPAYGGPICSLCCALDVRCHDLCKPAPARAAVQVERLLQRLLPRRWWPRLNAVPLRFALVMGLLVLPALGASAWWLHALELRQAAEQQGAAVAAALAAPMAALIAKGSAALLLVAGVIVWWLLLAQQSRRVAQEESNRQTEALMHEIESHRRTDAELQRAQREAEAANRAKSRYVQAISHELRTPLNSILGYAQLLDEDPSLPASRRQAVGVIRRGGEHLLSLIEGTLDIARIESGKLALEPRPLHLASLLAQIAGMFELQAAARGLAFEHHVAVAPAWVRADERRLAQILINVLGNAVKYTVRGRVRLEVRYAREMATFTIEDTGPGIAPEDLAQVFEPFARGAAAAGAGSGTGLGLTIAKMLTDLMGGELTVQSRSAEALPGGAADPEATTGTRFCIRLFLPEAPAPAAPLPKRRIRTGVQGPRRRVLVVDNEAVDRQLLARRLGPLGFDVLQADGGDAALALLGATRVDAVLLDLAMPGRDGWATLAALRAGAGPNAAVPVIVVSANVFEKGTESAPGAPAAAAQGFVTKPVRLDELLDALGLALGLAWHTEARPAGSTARPAAIPGPAAAEVQPALHALRTAIQRGHVRGARAALDRLEQGEPAAAAAARRWRGFVERFELDRCLPEIDAALRGATAGARPDAA
jgi:signal transduction histidine kinase/CheY-like chemotaxis protein